MKRSVAGMFLIVLAAGGAAMAAGPDNIRWRTGKEHDASVAEAKKTGVPMMIWFSGGGMPGGHGGPEEAFKDESVIKASENLICIKLEGGKDDKLFQKYGMNTPGVVFFDPEAKEVARVDYNKADAATVASQISDVVEKHTRGPKWADGGADQAFASGKTDRKPVILFFMDDGAKSSQFKRSFGDISLKPELFEKCIFVKIAYKKDDELAKTWKVTKAPTLVVVDSTGDAPKALRTLTSGGAKDIKFALEEAVKKLEKK